MIKYQIDYNLDSLVIKSPNKIADLGSEFCVTDFFYDHKLRIAKIIFSLNTDLNLRRIYSNVKICELLFSNINSVKNNFSDNY